MTLIEKQTVIDAIRGAETFMRVDDKGTLCNVIRVEDILTSLENISIQQQWIKLTGVELNESEWIKPTGMMPPEYHGHYECVKCGGWAMEEWGGHHRMVLTKFCPHCGRPMKNGVNE